MALNLSDGQPLPGEAFADVTSRLGLAPGWSGVSLSGIRMGNVVHITGRLLRTAPLGPAPQWTTVDGIVLDDSIKSRIWNVVAAPAVASVTSGDAYGSICWYITSANMISAALAANGPYVASGQWVDVNLSYLVY